MSWHIWEKIQPRRPSIGLHLQLLCRLLVLAHTQCQLAKGQVPKRDFSIICWTSEHLLFMRAGWSCNDKPVCLVAGLTISSVYTYQTSETSKIEVGQGDLRLTFSPNLGKFTNYVNTRNSVCNVLLSIYTTH